MEQGDRVRFNVDFLRSTGQFTGPEAPTSYGPFARGRVKETYKIGNVRDFAVVEWENGEETRVSQDALEGVVK